MLTGLDGARHGVSGQPKVLARVLILRRVAAADVSALQAHSQLVRGVSRSCAIGAGGAAGRLDTLFRDVTASDGQRLISHDGRLTAVRLPVESIDCMMGISVRAMHGIRMC